MKAKHLLLCVVLLILSASSFAQKTDCNELIEKYADARVVITRLRGDSTRYAAALKRDTTRINTLTEQLKAMQEALNSAQKEARDLKTSQSAAKIQAAERRADELQKKLDKANKDYGAMVAKKDAEIAKLNQQITLLKQQIEENNNTNGRIADAEAERDKYKQQLEAYMQRDVQNWTAKPFSNINSSELESAVKSYEEGSDNRMKMDALLADFKKYQRAVDVLNSEYDAVKYREAETFVSQMSATATGQKKKELVELGTKLNLFMGYVQSFQELIAEVEYHINKNDWSSAKRVFKEEKHKEILETVEEEWKEGAPWLYDQFQQYKNLVTDEKKPKDAVFAAGAKIKSIKP